MVEKQGEYGSWFFYHAQGILTPCEIRLCWVLKFTGFTLVYVHRVNLW